MRLPTMSKQLDTLEIKGSDSCNRPVNSQQQQQQQQQYTVMEVGLHRRKDQLPLRSLRDLRFRFAPVRPRLPR